MALKMYEQVDHAPNRKEEHDHKYRSHDYANSFRIKIQSPLESELTLLNMDADLENVEIIIENLGSGGLRFLSNLHLELDQEIIFSFESELLEGKIHLPGVIIWTEEISVGLFQCGVHFETPEHTRMFLNKLLGVS
jgi:hypothetical protein